jgi:hypothetical protein
MFWLNSRLQSKQELKTERGAETGKINTHKKIIRATYNIYLDDNYCSRQIKVVRRR